MHMTNEIPHISIRTLWSMHGELDTSLTPRAIELLAEVQTHGNLQAAAKAMGLSYRHAWDMVQKCEEHFKTPLVQMERGKGSKLTALGEKIVWADRRISATLKPVLDSLASEITSELGRVLDNYQQPLRLHASHGFAIERLANQLRTEGVALELNYGTSTAAVAALKDESCDAAGLHLPHGAAADASRKHYLQWLGTEDFVTIHMAVRRLGLIVRRGNPCEVFSLRDLTRHGVRFINRQNGSGTRLLLQNLMSQEGIDSKNVIGFEQSQPTHSAVAAHVAAGMADVGFGLEPPAREYKLDFVPIVLEDYFLLCRPHLLNQVAMRQLLEILNKRSFVDSLGILPGYDVSEAGRLSSW